jgi:hypothetical protein
LNLTEAEEIALIREIAENPHKLGHVIGMDLLTELHSDWIKYLWLSDEHVSLQAHRGSYKTTACTELGIIWWLLFNPDCKLGIIRQNKTAASDTLKAVTKHFQNPDLLEIFRIAHDGITPKVLSDAYGHLDMSFKGKISKEKSVDAHGVDSVTTGSHYDKIICDDVIVREDRLSRARRVKTIDGLREIYTNIINPGCQVVHVGTPWHPEDGWNAECVPTPRMYDIYETGLLDDDEIRIKRATTTPSLFAANYLLKHMADEDQLFKDPKYGNWLLSAPKVVAHLDAKFSGDHTAALTFAAAMPDGTINIRGYVFHENVKDKLGWIKEKYRQHKCKKLYIETNPDQGYTGDLLSRKDEYGMGLNVETYRESANKHNKIVTYVKEYWERLVFDHSMASGEYMSQVLDYVEKEEPDDAPDSLACILRAEFSKHLVKPSTMALYGGEGI